MEKVGKIVEIDGVKYLVEENVEQGAALNGGRRFRRRVRRPRIGLPGRRRIIRRPIRPGRPGAGLHIRTTKGPTIAEYYSHQVAYDGNIGGKRSFTFFTEDPDPERVLRNYPQAYIKKDLILQGVKIELVPDTVSWTVGDANANYEAQLSALMQATLKVMVDNVPIHQVNIGEIIEADDISVGMKATAQDSADFTLITKSKGFLLFRDIKDISTLTLTKDNQLWVKVDYDGTFPTAGSASNDWYVVCTLMVKTAKTSIV